MNGRGSYECVYGDEKKQVAGDVTGHADEGQLALLERDFRMK